MNKIFIRAEKLSNFIKKVLLKSCVREDVALCVTEGLVQTSLRGVDSHGVRLLPHYLAGVKGGRINPRPNYRFKKTSPSTGTLDADHTFGHAAGMKAAAKAVELANSSGIGALAVYNSTHFGAAAYYSLEIAKHDMIGFSFTHADSLIKTYAGKRAFFGTNPISFAAPCNGEGPLCLDMATSVVTFNKIKQFREDKAQAPKGVGANSEGVETTDPEAISMLLPIGGYKGYGLSMMVEILCSLLSGMPYGPYISSMYKAPIHQKRYLGHFVMAMKIDCFQDAAVFKKRLSTMMRELRKEPPSDANTAVQVPGDPEKKMYAERMREGIPFSKNTLGHFLKISEEFGIKLEIKRLRIK